MNAQLNTRRQTQSTNVVESHPAKVWTKSIKSPSRPLFNSNFIVLLASTHCTAYIGGIIAFPFEKVFLRHSMGLNTPHSSYQSVSLGLQHIYRTEGGFRGFYRGIGLRFIRISMVTVPLVVGDEVLRRVIVSAQRPLDIKGESLCAVLSGIAATTIHYPFDYARLTLQSGLHHGKTSRLKLIWSEMRDIGIRRVFQSGFGVSMWCNVTFSTILFPSFAALKYHHPLSVEQNLRTDAVYSAIACSLGMIGRHFAKNIDDARRQWLKGNGDRFQCMKQLIKLQKLVPNTLLQIPLISLSLSYNEYQKRCNECL